MWVLFLLIAFAACVFCFALVAAMEAVHEERSSMGATVALCISLIAVLGMLIFILYAR